MRQTLKATCAALALAAGTVQPALADLKAQDVFDLWTSLYEPSGMSVSTGSTNYSDGVLTARDLRVSGSDPSSGAVITVSFGDMVLTERDDGSVDVTAGADWDFSVEIDGGNPTVRGSFHNEGLFYNVAEDGDAMVLRSGIDSLELTDFALLAGGEPLPGATTDLVLQFDQSDGLARIANPDDGALDYSGTGSLGGLTAAGNFAMPGQESVKFRYEMNDMTYRMASLIPAEMRAAMNDPESAQDIANPFASGLKMEYEFQNGGSSVFVAVAGGSDDFTLDGSSEGGELKLILNPQEFQFALGSQNATYQFSSGNLPFPPMDASYSALSMNLAMPLEQTDEPGEYQANVTLRDFAVSDLLWMMFDPTQALPHDPATVVVDLSGQVDWLVDITDPDAMAAIEDGPPVLINTVDINDLTVSVAGAELLGTGAFDLDWQNLDPQGNPTPSGAADLSLRGGFALMDALGQIGLVPPDAAAGLKAMIGVFAKPGDSADHFISHIEMTPDGGISANGQRLR